MLLIREISIFAAFSTLIPPKNAKIHVIKDIFAFLINVYTKINMVKIYIQKRKKMGKFHVLFWGFIVYYIDRGDESNLVSVEAYHNIRELKEEEA